MRPRQLPMTWVAGVVGAAALVAIGLQGLPVAAPRAVDAPRASEAPAPAVSSLAGTTPDGGATATADDALVLDPALVRLFDYYLTTVGERPIAAIQAQVERDLDGRLAPHARRRTSSIATCGSRRP